MTIELKGRLDRESLGEVFRVLEQGDTACSFLVSDGVSEKIFYFAIGGIRMISLGARRGVPLGEILVKGGMLSISERDRALEHASRGGLSLGEALVEMGLISAKDIDSALRLQFESEICDLFFWSEAEYEFREGQPPPEFYDGHHEAVSVSCDVAEFIEGVRSRRARWEMVKARISSDRDVFAPTEEGRMALSSGSGSGVSLLLALVDGARTLRDIQEKSGWPTIEVFESLYMLLESGLIRRVVCVADSGRGSREVLLEEIRKLEESRVTAVGDLIVRTRLAKAYEKAGDHHKAAGIWKELARIHRRKNDLRRTLESLKSAVRCSPEDFNARELILEIYRVSGDREKFVEEGRIVAEMLFKNGLMNRAHQLLKGLLSSAPHDARMRKLNALTLLALGENDAALWELKELAQILERSGARGQELREVYRRILSLEKGNKVYRRKLLDASGNRKIIWLSRGLVAAAILVALAGGAMFLYERSARTSYLDEGLDLSGLMGQNRFEEARRQVDRIREEYPYSTVGRRANDLLLEIEAREREYLSKSLVHDLRRAELAELEGDWERAQEIYRRVASLKSENHPLVLKARSRLEEIAKEVEAAGRLVRRGRDLAAVGDLPGAHRIYTEVRELYPNSPAAASIRYPLDLHTVPVRARVYVNGVEQRGQRPLRIEYSLSSRTRLRMEMEGFEPLVIEIEEALPPQRTVFLQRRTRWVYEAEGPLEAGPMVRDGAVYVPGRDRFLHAVALEDGSILYRASLGIFGDTGSAVVFTKGAVVVASARGEGIGYHPEDGRVLWRRTFENTFQADPCGTPDGSLVILSDAAGAVTALDAQTGGVVWEVPAAAAAPGTAPVASDGLVFIGSAEQRRITALDVADGLESWSFPMRDVVSGSPEVAGGYLCFGSWDGRIYAVNISSRMEAASLKTASRVSGSPCIHRESVFVGCVDGTLYRFDLKVLNRLVWRSRLGEESAALSTPVVSDGKLYVGSADGRLYCVDAESGDLLWGFTTGGAILGAPAVSGETVLVGSMDGKLYAIQK